MNQFTQVVINFSMEGGTELIINCAADKDQGDDGNGDDNQDDVPVQRREIMIGQLIFVRHIRTAASTKIRVLPIFPSHGLP